MINGTCIKQKCPTLNIKKKTKQGMYQKKYSEQVLKSCLMIVQMLNSGYIPKNPKT